MTVVPLVVAGGLGAACRFAVDSAIRSRVAGRFPWATVVINVTGSLALGVLVGLVLHRGAPTALAAVAGTGFCGGYTTFSTATFETVRLVQARAFLAAALNAVGTVGLTLAAAATGLALTA